MRSRCVNLALVRKFWDAAGSNAKLLAFGRVMHPHDTAFQRR